MFCVQTGEGLSEAGLHDVIFPQNGSVIFIQKFCKNTQNEPKHVKRMKNEGDN